MIARRIVFAWLLLVFVSACGPLNALRDRQATSAAATIAATRGQPVRQGSVTPTPFRPLTVTPPPATVTAPASTPAPPNLTAPPPSPTAAPSASPIPGSILGQHVVAKGESLFCIGRGYGVLPSAIAQVNGLASGATLKPGQLLKIPAVQWTNIPSGPVCPPQFASPFSSAPTTTGTPVGAGSGAEVILILEPGGGSSIASPIHVAGQADPTFEQALVVQITDANGNVLATAPAQIQADLSQRGPFSVDVPFSVSADQPGRISVFSASARDGGLIHLASVEMTLRAHGPVSLVPGQSHSESIAIFTPASLAALSGGAAHLLGFSDYVFENQLRVVICGEGGSGAPDLICGTKDNVLGSGTAAVNSPAAGQPGPFTADVTYTVKAQVHGRVVVFDISPRDGGIVHLASQEVTLAP